MVKKIALVGTSESSVKLADSLDKSWQVWGCNGSYQMISGCDIHFELHTIPYLKTVATPKALEEYFEFMKFKGKNLVLNGKYEEFPEAQDYPINQVIEYFQHRYFNNTISYMIALAIMKNPDLEELAIFGIDMAADTEYSHQRPCTEFYLGWARAKGIKVLIPHVCPLLKTTHLYGFEPIPGYVQALREDQKKYEELAIKSNRDREAALINEAYIKGARDITKVHVRLYA